MQTVPVTAEELDLPPPYEPSPWSTSSGPPTSSAPGMTPATDSSRSSLSAEEHDGLVAPRLNESRSPGAGAHRRNSRCGERRRDANRPAGATSTGIDSTGYRANDPMQRFQDQSKWREMEDQPGFCCSDSAGCFGSSHGGCCFSDRGGCFFSDTEGCCFSDTGGCFFSSSFGCCFSETGGCFFSKTNGCCFGSEGACCCSDGPRARE